MEIQTPDGRVWKRLFWSWSDMNGGLSICGSNPMSMERKQLGAQAADPDSLAEIPLPPLPSWVTFGKLLNHL